MKTLFLPGFLGLSLTLLAAFGTAQACEANCQLGSAAMADRVPAPEAAQPKISFRNDGNDVIASVQVTANGSPHALWTAYDISTNNVVTLRYCLIQNSDQLVRCLKSVTIEWRLKNFAVLPSPLLTYRVEGSSLAPKSQELKDLIPQLQLLIADKVKQEKIVPKR
jgi:hypothetical protein